MANDRSDREAMGLDPAGETSAAHSGSPTHYHTALSQLNRSDDPEGGGTPQIDQASEPPGDDTRANSAAAGAERRSAARLLADTVEIEFALSRLKGATAPNGTVEQSIDPTIERVDQERSDLDRQGDPTDLVPFSAVSADYQLAIMRMIRSMANDPRQLRQLVYEFARINIKEEAQDSGALPISNETGKCLSALEVAIERVEADLAEDDLAAAHASGSPGEQERSQSGPVRDRSFQAKSVETYGSRSAIHFEPEMRPSAGSVSRSIRSLDQLRPSAAVHAVQPSQALGRPAVEIVYPERDKADAVVRRRIWLWFIAWPLIQLISVGGFCFALYIAVSSRLDLQDAQNRQAIAASAQQAPPEQPAPPSSGLPLPSTYGVYAVSNGRLNELRPLPIRAPDPRIQLSVEINKPSSTILPDGKASFIIFQRDLLNSAPQSIPIRIVARVTSTLNFGSGKAEVVKKDASWYIRSNSYDFQVSPLPESREMVAVRPDDPAFVLPAGRYALVFGDAAYDFTIDGPITDPAQCLEGFESPNGPVFNECRNKRK